MARSTPAQKPRGLASSSEIGRRIGVWAFMARKLVVPAAGRQESASLRRHAYAFIRLHDAEGALWLRLALSSLHRTFHAPHLHARPQRPDGRFDRRDQGGDDDQAAKKKKRDEEWNQPKAPLQQLRNAGPCPFVKVLYDASRYVEFKDGKESAAQGGVPRGE